MDTTLNSTAAEETDSWDSRTVRLLGPEAVDRLARARVLVVGLGGVGGYTVEMLARSGVGELTLLDADDVAPSNLNRQIIALRSTLGRPKAALFAERIADINPECRVHPLEQYLTVDTVPETVGTDRYDLVVDAIDTVAPKVELLAWCLEHRIPVLSSMGAGGRTDPAKVCCMDLWETRDDGLARAVRQRLKARGLRRPVRVVASTEPPRTCSLVEVNTANKRTSYGTIATIPSLFGIFLAAEAIRMLTHNNNRK